MFLMRWGGRTVTDEPDVAGERPEEFEAAEFQAMGAAQAAVNTRPPRLQGPKRQHFLPQFYLEGFTRDGLVAVFDRQEDEIRLQQPVNTAVIGHFYTMRDAEGRRRFEVEEMLSEFEGKAKIAIDKLIGGAGELNEDERSDLAVFLSLAANRTPDMVNSLQYVNGEMVKRMAKTMFHNEETTFQDLRRDEKHAGETDEELRAQANWMVTVAKHDGFEVKTDEKWAVGMAIKLALKAAPYFARRHWRVVHRANEKQSFITCDAPVYLTSVDPRPSFYGVGFGSSNAFIAFPLHQSCVLEMFDNDGRLTHKMVGRDYMRMVNTHLARRCQRFVVGRDAALLKSLAEELGLAKTKWEPKFSVN
jgi:hypothetical protein